MSEPTLPKCSECGSDGNRCFDADGPVWPWHIRRQVTWARALTSSPEVKWRDDYERQQLLDLVAAYDAGRDDAEDRAYGGTWTCGDCGNSYDESVHHCPNQEGDRIAVEDVRGALCES